MSDAIIHHGVLSDRSYRLSQSNFQIRSVAQHQKSPEMHLLASRPDLSASRQHHIVYQRQFRSERQVTNAFAHAVGRVPSYPSFWSAVAIAGIVIAAVGFIVGVSFPGPLTGILFPIGMTLLAVVGYLAEERSGP